MNLFLVALKENLKSSDGLSRGDRIAIAMTI